MWHGLRLELSLVSFLAGRADFFNILFMFTFFLLCPGDAEIHQNRSLFSMSSQSGGQDRGPDNYRIRCKDTVGVDMGGANELGRLHRRGDI